MKKCSCRPPLGGPFPSPEHAPPPPQPAWGGYLMQCILASGQIHRRLCAEVCVDALPPDALPPLTVLEATVSGTPCWQESSCQGRGGMTLQVTVPLCVRARDDRGRTYAIPAQVEETLFLRPACPADSCWRGQVFVQAAARLAGQACLTERNSRNPLEVCIQAYLLAPCKLGAPSASCCPDARPWYPDFSWSPGCCGRD